MFRVIAERQQSIQEGRRRCARISHAWSGLFEADGTSTLTAKTYLALARIIYLTRGQQEYHSTS